MKDFIIFLAAITAILCLIRICLGAFKSKNKTASCVPVEMIRKGSEKLLSPSAYEEYYNKIANAADSYNNVREYHLTIKCIQVFQNVYASHSNILFDVHTLIVLLEKREHVLNQSVSIWGLRII